MQAVTGSRARRWRGAAGVFASVLAALGALACGEPETGCDGEGRCRNAGPLELATWWGTRGELYASFAILKQSYQDATHGQIELAHQLPNKDEHTLWVEEQMRASEPVEPALDVFAANNGDEILRWTPCAAWGPAPEQPRLVGLTDPALGPLHLRRDWIEATFEPRVMETLQCDGETYALPVGIHRVNTLFFNKALFRAAGYAVDELDGTPLPTTLAELHEAAARVTEQLPEGDPESGLPPSAFAVAGREAWTVSLFFIENVMLSLAGSAERYESYWGGATCDEPLLESTVHELSRLSPFFGSSELNSTEARERVQNGQAAMMVMGDWAAAELDPRLVGAMPFPGTAQYFVFTADVFALPALETASPDNGLAWLRSMTERQTQQQFSIAKGALPARADLQGARLGAAGELSWVRSLPSLLPYGEQAAFAALASELRRWLRSGASDGAALLRYAREQYAKLSDGAVVCPMPGAPPSAGIAEIQ